MSKPVMDDIFSFSGRRNRKSYLLYLLLMVLIVVAAWSVAVIMTVNGEWTMITIAGIISFLVVISHWIVGAQRCRDFGWTGWAMLLTLVPYLGPLFTFAIIFIPGNIGPNRYGPDPLGTSNPY